MTDKFELKLSVRLSITRHFYDLGYQNSTAELSEFFRHIFCLWMLVPLRRKFLEALKAGLKEAKIFVTRVNILDRLLHHSEVVIIEGKSYRMKNRTSSEK